MTTLDQLEALAKAALHENEHPLEIDLGDISNSELFCAEVTPMTILALIALVRQQHEALKWCADDELDSTVREALAAFENFGKE